MSVYTVLNLPTWHATSIGRYSHSYSVRHFLRGWERGSARRSSLKGERGSSSLRQTLQLFQRQRWGNFFENLCFYVLSDFMTCVFMIWVVSCLMLSWLKRFHNLCFHYFSAFMTLVLSWLVLSWLQRFQDLNNFMTSDFTTWHKCFHDLAISWHMWFHDLSFRDLSDFMT